MIETTVTISQTDAETPASAEIDGRLVSMYDADGAYVFADSVKYATGKTTVTIDFGGSHTEEFTVVVTKPINVNA
jgi:ribosomal protein S24E